MAVEKSRFSLKIPPARVLSSSPAMCNFLESPLNLRMKESGDVYLWIDVLQVMRNWWSCWPAAENVFPERFKFHPRTLMDGKRFFLPQSLVEEVLEELRINSRPMYARRGRPR